jgi:CheY-like chemotaxis protein
LPPILADKAQLETVLINLGVNARDAMPSGGALSVAAVADSRGATPDFPSELGEGAFVRLCVTDTGTGMTAETLARACEPFFTTKPEGKGTGLGLAMARGFASQSGGAFRIDSEPGRGTRVTLWFPQAGRDVQASEPASAARPHGLPAARVLVVDDDAMVLEVLVGQLRELGSEVVPAPDGRSALGLLDAGQMVDLLVTDLSMPGMSGRVLIDEARRRRPALPAVLLTGYADPDLAFDAGANPPTVLLRKPVIFDEFAESLRGLLAG